MINSATDVKSSCEINLIIVQCQPFFRVSMDDPLNLDRIFSSKNRRKSVTNTFGTKDKTEHGIRINKRSGYILLYMLNVNRSLLLICIQN